MMDSTSEAVNLPSLKWNTPRVKTFIVNSNNLLVTLLTDDDTSITPREIVLLPKTVNWKD